MTNPVLYSSTLSSPVGEISIGVIDDAIVAVRFTFDEIEKIACCLRVPLVKNATHPLLEQCSKELNEYFSHQRKSFDLPLHFVGTDFQQRVWKVLLSIPYGSTVSYREEAEKLKALLAVRAVARANGANPIAILVPCHRVIGSDGSLTGYTGGLEIKKYLLDWEQNL